MDPERRNSILPDEGGPSSGSKKIRRSRYPYVQQHQLSLLLCLTGLGQPESVFQLFLYLTVLGNPSRFCYSISSPSQHKSTQMLPYSHSYSRFVTADSDSPLDRSRGRVQLIDGDLYYSPNSQRSVHVPPVYDNIPFSDNFKDSFSRFRQPLWWQPACPYLAFVPTQPVFAGVPFQDLFHISIFPPRSDRSYAIDPKIILGWVSLERDIRDAANLILAHERAPPITWLISTSLGCTGGYRYVRLLQTEYRNSKGWFSLFMGGLSYAIAISISQR